MRSIPPSHPSAQRGHKERRPSVLFPPPGARRQLCPLWSLRCFRFSRLSLPAQRWASQKRHRVLLSLALSSPAGRERARTACRPRLPHSRGGCGLSLWASGSSSAAESPLPPRTNVRAVFGGPVGIRDAAVDPGQLQRPQPSTGLLRGLASDRALRPEPSSARFREPLLLFLTWPPCLPSPWPFGS